MIKPVEIRTHRGAIGTMPFLGTEMIEYLKKKTRQGGRVLEFGCGGSTIWFALRGCEVVSYEHSQLWADRVLELLKEYEDSLVVGLKVDLRVRPKYPILGMEELEGFFDIILVDGRRRSECMEFYHKNVRKGGLLALDNSEVEKWQPGVTFMDCLGWEKIKLNGFRAHSRSRVWERCHG